MDDKTTAGSSQSALDAYRAAQREEEAWLEKMRAAAKAKEDAPKSADKD